MPGAAARGAGATWRRSRARLPASWLPALAVALGGLCAAAGASGEALAGTAGDGATPPGAGGRAAPTVTIEALDFQRGEAGEGLVLLRLSEPAEDVASEREGDRLNIEFPNAAAREALRRTYDVTEFATPVVSLELAHGASGVKLSLLVAGDFDYRARQAGQQYVISVAAAEPRAGPRDGAPDYVGERMSLNFQDIETRSVLQLIADFARLNLIASDSVTGRVTLRLHDVPWDQALDIVLKSGGLDKRQTGNVLLVAPAAEIAEHERQEIEANRQAAELAPLQSDFIRIRYANAAELVALLEAAGGGGEAGASLLSARGSVTVDERTNSLLITDTADRLDALRDFISQVDIPIRQVMIEARIVIAQSDASRNLGIRWGGAALDAGSGAIRSISGSLGSVVSIGEEFREGKVPEVAFPGALLVDLGVTEPSGSFAVGYASDELLLAAELSALESAGSGEVISRPKVITGDKQPAAIKSGTEVPFQESSANGETTTSFKEAVLRLDVTPNIIPDERILLDLQINQDAVGELVPSGNGGFIPSIDTTELTTQVLVGDGETVVLGGVFRTEELHSTSKVPLLGDIPYMGRLFKSTTTRKTRTETLIFITPSILAETLLD